MMNYAQVIAEIEQLKIGKKFVNVEPLLKKFEEFSGKTLEAKVLYVPSSYEKESLGEFIEAILREHKFSVGRFTPFAVKRPCSHILYQGKPITQKEFAKWGEQVQAAFEGKEQSEVLFFIALCYLAEKNCDYIILPSDEKCDFTDLENSSLKECLFQKRSLQKQIYSTDGYENLEISVASKIEAENSVLAIRFLEREHIRLQEKAVRKALGKYKGIGKFEVLRTKPYFIADGADNDRAVKNLMANLQYYFPDNPYIFIVGTLQEGYEGVVKESALMAQQIITVTPPEMQNALPAIELAKEYKKLNLNITNSSSVEEAVEIATILAGKEGVVTAFGSTTILEKFNLIANK